MRKLLRTRNNLIKELIKNIRKVLLKNNKLKEPSIQLKSRLGSEMLVLRMKARNYSISLITCMRKIQS
jgi:hypothetical protein